MRHIHTKVLLDVFPWIPPFRCTTRPYRRRRGCRGPLPAEPGGNCPRWRDQAPGRRVRQADRPHHPLEPHVPRAFTTARGGNAMKPGSSGNAMKPGSSANALEAPWRPLGRISW